MSVLVEFSTKTKYFGNIMSQNGEMGKKRKDLGYRIMNQPGVIFWNECIFKHLFRISTYFCGTYTM